MFDKIVKILISSNIFLSLFGTIIGVVWLAILGDWEAVLTTVPIWFILPHVLPLSLLPGFLIGLIATYFYKKKSFLWPLFSIITQFYINMCVLASCVVVFLLYSSAYFRVENETFFYFINNIDYFSDNTGFNYIPYLLLSWTLPINSLRSLAVGEKDSQNTLLILTVASISHSLFLLSVFISFRLGLIVLIVWGIVQFVIPSIFSLHVLYADIRIQKEMERDIPWYH